LKEIRNQEEVLFGMNGKAVKPYLQSLVIQKDKGKFKISLCNIMSNKEINLYTDKPWTDKPWTGQTLDTTNPGHDKPWTE
jgi:hypothetical protein